LGKNKAGKSNFEKTKARKIEISTNPYYERRNVEKRIPEKSL
jgi:hypothetical protein